MSKFTKGARMKAYKTLLTLALAAFLSACGDSQETVKERIIESYKTTAIKDYEAKIEAYQVAMDYAQAQINADTGDKQELENAIAGIESAKDKLEAQAKEDFTQAFASALEADKSAAMKDIESKINDDKGLIRYFGNKINDFRMQIESGEVAEALRGALEGKIAGYERVIDKLKIIVQEYENIIQKI